MNKKCMNIDQGYIEWKLFGSFGMMLNVLEENK